MFPSQTTCYSLENGLHTMIRVKFHYFEVELRELYVVYDIIDELSDCGSV